MEQGDKFKIGFGVFVATTAALGAGCTIALNRASARFGLDNGLSNIVLGIIGAVQQLGTMILIRIFPKNMLFESEKNIRWSVVFLNQVCMGIALAGLTVLAWKVNLISGHMTLFGTAALITTSFIEFYLIGKGLTWWVDSK